MNVAARSRRPKPLSVGILTVAAMLLAAIVMVAGMSRRGDAASGTVAGVETPPRVIRIGGPGAYDANPKIGGLVTVARAKGFFQREFAGQPTRLEFVGFNTVPMVGEALASGAIDFAEQGELIALLTRSKGTETRLLMPTTRLENAYLMVPIGSPIRGIADIRGKRIAYMRGAYIHIQTMRILAHHGLSERDIVPVNLDPASAVTVLASRGVDGVFVGRQAALHMRDAGIGRIAYSTRQSPLETAQVGLVVRSEFAARYPDTTKRIVRALVRAAQWTADPRNRLDYAKLSIWTDDTPVSRVVEDFGPGSWIGRTSPLLDRFSVSQYRGTQAAALEARLLRRPVDLSQWIDRRILDAVIREEGLDDVWPALDAAGRILSAEDRLTT